MQQLDVCRQQSGRHALEDGMEGETRKALDKSFDNAIQASGFPGEGVERVVVANLWALHLVGQVLADAIDALRAELKRAITPATIGGSGAWTGNPRARPIAGESLSEYITRRWRIGAEDHDLVTNAQRDVLLAMAMRIDEQDRRIEALTRQVKGQGDEK